MVIDTLCNMLNRGVHPVIPSQGSAGASGDLAPPAHLALVPIGEGGAGFAGCRWSGGEAMRAAQIATIRLEAKEAISLMNRTQAMLAVGSLALLDAETLAATADVLGAISLDALQGTDAAIDQRISTGRVPNAGQMLVAGHLRAMLEGFGAAGAASRLQAGAGRLFYVLHPAGTRGRARCAGVCAAPGQPHPAKHHVWAGNEVFVDRWRRPCRGEICRLLPRGAAALPPRSRRSIRMSVVNSVPALRLNASLGRRIAPSNSARVDSDSREPESILSIVPRDVMNTTRPPARTFSSAAAKK